MYVTGYYLQKEEKHFIINYEMLYLVLVGMNLF